MSALKGISSQLICNDTHRFLAAQQCYSSCIDTEIVLEPVRRNTAPAIISAALRLIELGRDEPMLIMSADHYIEDEKTFCNALLSAHEFAQSGNVVTLGVKPKKPSTGYGYIRCGAEVRSLKSKTGYLVKKFVEKPNMADAERYLSQGNYLWNSGIFVALPSVLIEEASLYCAELLENCRLAVKFATKDLDFIRLPKREFSKCSDISIDYAIMEYTQKALVIPVDCGWHDVGDFHGLWNVNEKDQNGNVLQGDVIALDSHNCFVKSQNRLVSVIGLEEIAVIETKDAVSVIPFDKAQLTKDLFKLINGREESTSSSEVFRPWGSYDVVEKGENYQVKRISVHPGAQLSLQKHEHRAEHWVVVVGTAAVHLDGTDYLLNANESIYIPLGSVHRLANETELPLHLVEVQSGSYLGEDDIIRLEDVYGRSVNGDQNTMGHF